MQPENLDLTEVGELLKPYISRSNECPAGRVGQLSRKVAFLLVVLIVHTILSSSCLWTCFWSPPLVFLYPSSDASAPAWGLVWSISLLERFLHGNVSGRPHLAIIAYGKEKHFLQGITLPEIPAQEECNV
jgi:hypothetical protein